MIKFNIQIPSYVFMPTFYAKLLPSWGDKRIVWDEVDDNGEHLIIIIMVNISHHWARTKLKLLEWEMVGCALVRIKNLTQTSLKFTQICEDFLKKLYFTVKLVVNFKVIFEA